MDYCSSLSFGTLWADSVIALLITLTLQVHMTLKLFLIEGLNRSSFKLEIQREHSDVVILLLDYFILLLSFNVICMPL